MSPARKALAVMYASMSAAIGLLFGIAHAQSRSTPSYRIKFESTTLKNGLRVITAEDHSAPVIALCVTYNVGARDEKKGRTGYAHLFEHMMFKGSKNVGPGEHKATVINNGGIYNGQTTEERTIYYEVLPANQLDMAIFLEADRMRGLIITKENLDNQRNAVQEEYRLRISNQPYGSSWEVLQDALFENFAYKHFGSGTTEDLNAATVQAMQEFFRIYYAPNNAVLTLAGDFNTQEALAKIKKAFESVPRQPDPPPVDLTEPEQAVASRRVMEDPLARAPRVLIGFKTVPSNTPEYYALEAIKAALLDGQSARLYQRLIGERSLVQSLVGGPLRVWRGPNVFYIAATLRPGKSVQEVESVILKEIERLQKEPLADWEIEKAKNSARLAFIKSIQTPQGVAVTLGEYAILYNEPDLINTRLAKVDAITKEDVRSVAEKYLAPNRRTVIVITPKTKSQVSAPAGP